jgi:hypothetical protein
VTESTFMEGIGEVHLLSWHRDHFKLKCKGAPAYAVITMKRTQCFYTYRVYKGGTATINLVPFQGWGFFVFGKEAARNLHIKKEEIRCKND